MGNRNCRVFTPGPWRVYDNGFFYDIKGPWRGRSVVEDHSPSLCQVFYEGCDGVVGKPNAQLMAAAPELLAELENIAQAAVDVKDVEDNEKFRAWVFSRAKQAIAKVFEQEIIYTPGAKEEDA